MATIRKRILDEIVVALSTSPPAGVPATTTLDKLTPSEVSDLPVMSVFSGREDAERIGGSTGPVTRRRMSIFVECWATGTDLHEKLDPMLAWITKTLNGQRVLDGSTQLSHEMEELATEWDWEHVERKLGRAEVELVISYSTKSNDQEVTQ